MSVLKTQFWPSLNVTMGSRHIVAFFWFLKNMTFPFLHMFFTFLLLFRKRLEHQQKMLEEDRKRRQFEEQKQKLRLLSSVKPKVSPSSLCLHPVHIPRSCVMTTLQTLLGCSQTGEKSRDDALEAIKGNLDGFSRDAKMHPTPSSQTKKPGTFPSLFEFDFLPFSL